MVRDFYHKHQAFFDRFEGLFISNTVLEKGLVLAPVVVVATTLKNALAVGIAFVIVTFFTVFITSFFPKMAAYAIRVTLHTIIASIILLLIAPYINQFIPDVIYKIGIFFPLIATNSLIVGKSRTRFHKKKKFDMTIDLLSHVLGFFVVICIVGIIREVFASGTIFDFPVKVNLIIPSLDMPFSGFIIVGFLAAFVQGYRIFIKSPDKKRYKKR